MFVADGARGKGDMIAHHLFQLRTTTLPELKIFAMDIVRENLK